MMSIVNFLEHPAAYQIHVTHGLGFVNSSTWKNPQKSKFLTNKLKVNVKTNNVNIIVYVYT